MMTYPIKYLKIINSFSLINILFLIFFTDAYGQNFKLKVHVSDPTTPLTGVSVLINNKVIGNSNSLGDFEGAASVGDTLLIKYPFYELYTRILNDTSKQNITLTTKVVQLNDVNIHFDKRRVIDSLLKTAFSKLSYRRDSRRAFLRQSATKKASEILLNEGVLTFKCPAMNELVIPLAGYKKIYMNVESSCNLIFKAENKLMIKSNPQIKLRRAYIPDYFYREMITHMEKESIRSDSNNTFISLSGYLPKFKIKTTYIYTIDSKMNDLKQIQYYEEADNKKKLFFFSFNYSENEFVSVYSSAKHIRSGNHYSLNDELILGKSVDTVTPLGNYKPNIGGLEHYDKGGDCAFLNDYKKANAIPEQQYFN